MACDSWDASPLNGWRGEIGFHGWLERLALERPSMLAMCSQVAAAHDVSVAVIRGPSRKRPYVRARQHFMSLALEAGFSTTQVGNFLSRDHTTCIWGARKHRGALARGEEIVSL